MSLLYSQSFLSSHLRAHVCAAHVELLMHQQAHSSSVLRELFVIFVPMILQYYYLSQFQVPIGRCYNLTNYSSSQIRTVYLIRYLPQTLITERLFIVELSGICFAHYLNFPCLNYSFLLELLISLLHTHLNSCSIADHSIFGNIHAWYFFQKHFIPFQWQLASLHSQLVRDSRCYVVSLRFIRSCASEQFWCAISYHVIQKHLSFHVYLGKRGQHQG